MYKVLGTLQSRVLRVVWMLEELGQVYEFEPHAPHSAEVLAHSPTGKIPVLLTAEGPLTDSTAILYYLAERHGAFLAPAGTRERALQDALVFQILDEVEALIWTAARHSFILPPEARVPQIKDSLKAEYARNLDSFAKKLDGQDYLTGSTPQLPDFLLAHCLSWAQIAKFPAPPADVAAHLARMQARPAFARALARG